MRLKVKMSRCPSCNGKDCIEDLGDIWYCNECGANIKKEIKEDEDW